MNLPQGQIVEVRIITMKVVAIEKGAKNLIHSFFFFIDYIPVSVRSQVRYSNNNDGVIVKNIIGTSGLLAVERRREESYLIQELCLVELFLGLPEFLYLPYSLVNFLLSIQYNYLLQRY
jgi:hypothetical protein